MINDMEEKLTITIDKVGNDLNINIDGQCADATLLLAVASVVRGCFKQEVFTVPEFLQALVKLDNDIDVSGTVESIILPDITEGDEE